MFTSIMFWQSLLFLLCFFTRHKVVAQCNSAMQSTYASVQLNMKYSANNCTVNDVPVSYTFPPSPTYDLLGPASYDPIAETFGFWNNPDFYFTSPLTLTIVMLTYTYADPNTASFQFEIFQSCVITCGSQIGQSGNFTISGYNPLASCNPTCPYANKTNAEHCAIFQIETTLNPGWFNPASYFRLKISGVNVVYSPTMMTIGSTEISYTNPYNGACSFFLTQTLPCQTASCSNSKSHASHSHMSVSHKSSSHSHHSMSHESPSQTPTPSLSPSPNYGTKENCTTPLHTIRIRNNLESDYYYDYIIGNIDFYNSGFGGYLPTSKYIISQAGSDNCKSFNLIKNLAAFQFVKDPLYLNITRISPDVHNVAGIQTQDPLFNVSLTYIGPTGRDEYSLAYTLGAVYYFNPPYGIGQMRQVEGGGAIDPLLMCDVFQHSTVAAFGDYERFASSGFFGYNAMYCELVNFGNYAAPNITCDVACCPPDSHETNCTCFFIVLNCNTPFFQYENYNESFALLNPLIRPNHEGPPIELFMTDISISDGNNYVPLQFIKNTNSNNKTCPNPVQPMPVTFSLPQCCSPGYNTQFYSLPPSSVTTNLNQQYPQQVPFESNKCPYQRVVQTSRQGFDPFVGISVPIEPGLYAQSIGITFIIYLTPEHINYYLEQLSLATPDTYNTTVFPPVDDGLWHQPLLYMPTAFYSTKCGQKIPACENGEAINDYCTLTEYIDWDVSTYTIEFCPQLYEFLRSGPENIILNNPTSPPSYTIYPDTGYSFTVKMEYVNIYPAVDNRPDYVGEIKSTDSLFLNIAWSNFFPGDTVYIADAEFDFAEIVTRAPSHKNATITSELCTAPPVTMAQCGCVDCGNLVNTNKPNDSLSYVTSPIMFDDAAIQNPDPPFVTGRKLMNYNPAPTSPDTLIFPQQVSSNLRLFVNQSNVLNPYVFTGLGNQTGTARQVLTDNNCGVYMTVADCSNNLQVWLSPSQNVSYLNTDIDPLSQVNFFTCHVLIPDSVGVIIPLTRGVFVSSWDESTHFADSTNEDVAQTLYTVSIYTNFITNDPLMQFALPAYGFEIPMTQQGPFAGIYLFCDMNIYVGVNKSLPLFSSKGVCMSNVTGLGTGIAVANNTEFFNTTAYAKNNSNAVYSFHFMASPQCPAYSMCPESGWFINDDYSVDISNLGQRIRIPNDPLNPNNGTASSEGVIPYTVDINFKFNTPELANLFNVYQSLNPDLNSLTAGLFLQAPIEQQNFLDVDIYTTDGSCAFANLCQNILVNSTYNNTGFGLNRGIATLSQRVWGEGTKLENSYDMYFNNLDVIGIGFVIGPCLAALNNQGYPLDALSIRLRFTIDENAYEQFAGQRGLNGVDYTAADTNISMSENALDFDGLARRFYLYGAFVGIVNSSTSPFYNAHTLPVGYPDSYVLYRPSQTCPRQGFTPPNWCGGACYQILERNIMSGTQNISAKAENHPNSTMYDDLVMDSDAINQFLLNINMTALGAYYDYNNLFIDNPNIDYYWGIHQGYEEDYYTEGKRREAIRFPNPRWQYNSDLCNYYIEKVAHDIAVNGSGYAFKTRFPEEYDFIVEGIKVAIFGGFASFKTELLVEAMNDFGITIAPPFFPGVFVDYDNNTQEVHVFGTAIGLAVPFSENYTSFVVPATVRTFRNNNNLYNYEPEFPMLKMYFIDMIIPNVTRDMLNNDADLISHARYYKPGPYFSKGTNPFEDTPFCFWESDDPDACGPDQPFTVKSVSMCGLQYLNVNPLADTDQAYKINLIFYNSYFENNIVSEYTPPIPYPEILGVDKNITMRMGNGITESGILGALPVVSSMYSRGLAEYSYMVFNYWLNGNPYPQNGTAVGQRFRMALYPCGTSCPNNATHYFDNHPQFSALLLSNGSPSPPDLTSYKVADFSYVDDVGYTYVYGNNSNLIYDPLTDNLVGGMVINLGNEFMGYSVVFNVNQAACFEMLSYATTNTGSYVFDPLDVLNPDQSVGFYMNLRDTLGNIQLYGLVCGTIYEDTKHGIYPNYIVMVNYGGSNNLPNLNPNFNLYPILRAPDSSLLYLDVGYWVNDTYEGEFDTANADLYLVNNNYPAALFGTFSTIFGGGIKYTDSFQLMTNYPLTDANAVTLFANFETVLNFGGGSPLSSGMLMICKDCWNAFDDATYFDWSNTCTTFQLCSYNHSNYPDPFTNTSVIGCNPITNNLGFVTLTNKQTSVGIQWIKQALPASYYTMFSMNFVVLYTGFPVTIWANSTINNVTFGKDYVFGSQYTSGAINVVIRITVIAPFDGNTVDMVVNLNSTQLRLSINGIVLNYTNPVHCQPQSASQTFTQTFSSSHSLSPSPARHYCCVRNVPFTTFVDPYNAPTNSQSQPLILWNKKRKHQSLADVANEELRRQTEEDSADAVPHDMMRRETITLSHSHHSKSTSQYSKSTSYRSKSTSFKSKSVSHHSDSHSHESASHQSSSQNSVSHSQSQSPSWQKQTIYVCDPLPPVSVTEYFINGTDYQIRDEFVPPDNQFTYSYQHMGMRMGGLWLQFSSDTNGVNATSVKMHYDVENDRVIVSGYAWGVWSLPPNRVGLITEYGLNQYFDSALWYFEMTYTTGFIVHNNLTRAPYGSGGIPLAIQERDPRSGQFMNVTASVNNMGFIRHTKYDSYNFRISATDMNFDVYLDPINDAIEQLDNHTQFMILSVPDTPIGYTGWFGIGQLAAWPCLNYTIPDWENRYYQDFIGNPVWDMFLYFLCIDREYFDHEFDDYYLNNTNVTFGIGEYMFVVESSCPHESHSESHSHSHHSHSHRSHAIHSPSQKSHSHHSKSHRSQSHHSETHNSKSHKSKSKSHRSKTASHRSHSHKSKSASHASKSQSHNSESLSSSHYLSAPSNLLPKWAFYLIIIGCPVLSILLITCAFYGAKGARTRLRANSEGREPLLPQNEIQGHAQKQGAVSSSYTPPVHSSQEYALVSKKNSYYNNKTN